uniref:Uncharacterized protein n=1 Tax=viral metagenome TaxID=1070528 RepID=A0A6C0AR42_9ZZZZ
MNAEVSALQKEVDIIHMRLLRANKELSDISHKIKDNRNIRERTQIALCDTELPVLDATFKNALIESCRNTNTCLELSFADKKVSCEKLELQHTKLLKKLATLLTQ